MSARIKRKPYIVVLLKYPKAFLRGHNGGTYFSKSARKFKTEQDAQAALAAVRLATGLPFPEGYAARLATPENPLPKPSGASNYIIADDIE